MSAVDREALADIPNVYTYQSFVETDKAGYVIRQWVASSLYDRIRYVHIMLHASPTHLTTNISHSHSVHPAHDLSSPPLRRNGLPSNYSPHFATPAIVKSPMATSKPLTFSSRPGTGSTSPTLHLINLRTFHWTTQQTTLSSSIPVDAGRVTLHQKDFMRRMRGQGERRRRGRKEKAQGTREGWEVQGTGRRMGG